MCVCTRKTHQRSFLTENIFVTISWVSCFVFHVVSQLTASSECIYVYVCARSVLKLHVSGGRVWCLSVPRVMHHSGCKE